MTDIKIPADIFESPAEMVVIIPLGGVKRDSLSLTLYEGSLHLSAERIRPDIKENLVPREETCYWGNFKRSIQLPE